MINKLTDGQTYKPHTLHCSRCDGAGVRLVAKTMDTHHRVKTTVKDHMSCKMMYYYHGELCTINSAIIVINYSYNDHCGKDNGYVIIVFVMIVIFWIL